MDNLSYTYNGNQVVKIDDDAEDPIYNGCFTFKDGADEDTEYEYDGNGNLTKDLNRDIWSIEYNCLNLPESVSFGDDSYILYTYNAKGEKMSVAYFINQMTPTVPQVGGGTGGGEPQTRFTLVNYWNGLVFEGNTLKQIPIEGGYVTFNGSTPQYHFYIQDHLGNNRLVCNSSGTIEQINHYYPYGGLMGDSEDITSTQRYKYNGKELDRMHGLNLYDYGARQYDAAICQFTTMDPLAEKYYNVSPYAYCAGNPVMYVDPDGRETHVKKNPDGTYEVLGGILNEDRSIFVYTRNKSGIYSVRGERIGITSSTTSFYNSDAFNNKGAWAVGVKIDPNDNSGKEFLNKIVSEQVTLDDYMEKARNNHPYDFKVTNGDEHVVSKDYTYIYRGMSIGKSISGQRIYSSARDIGNMAAGIVAANNGIPWAAARIAFDTYQGGKEGLSTQNAEYYGWSKTYFHSNGISESAHVRNSISSVINKIWNKIF